MFNMVHPNISYGANDLFLSLKMGYVIHLITKNTFAYFKWLSLIYLG